MIPVGVELTSTGRRWRHICHQLLASRTIMYESAWAPLPSFLRNGCCEDRCHNCPKLASTLEFILHFANGFALIYEVIVPLLLDPTDRCKRLRADLSSLLACKGAWLPLRCMQAQLLEQNKWTSHTCRPSTCSMTPICICVLSQVIIAPL